MAVTPEGTTSASYSGTGSPSITFGTSPIEDDVIVVAVGSIGSAALSGAPPTGWTNCLGAGAVVTPGDGSVFVAVLYHVVTAAEDTANTVTWTLTDLWVNVETGDVVAGYFRGVDVAAVIDAFGTASAATNANPHTLPAVTGTDITSTGGLVLRGVVKDTAGTHTTPAGHTQLVTSNTNHGLWLGTRDMTATAATNVDAVDITPSASDEYVSYTVVITPAAAAGPNVGSASGSIAWAGTVTGTTTRSGAASGAISWAGTSTGATVHSGAAAGAVDWVGSATGVSAHNGVASGAISWVGTATGEAPTLAQEGSAAGVITWSGTASGTAVHSGTASGAVTWTGAATGVTARSGAASGAVTWVGVAAGASPRYGAATGTVTWVGVVTGDQPALFVIGTTIATTRSATTTATVIVSDTTADTIAPSTTATEIAA